MIRLPRRASSASPSQAAAGTAEAWAYMPVVVAGVHMIGATGVGLIGI
jgi:hypothetical protein